MLKKGLLLSQQPPAVNGQRPGEINFGKLILNEKTLSTDTKKFRIHQMRNFPNRQLPILPDRFQSSTFGV